MNHRPMWPTRSGWATFLPLMVMAALLGFRPAGAQSFPDVPIWAFPGVPQAGPDTVLERSRTISVRFVRDPVAESKPEFGGYRLYRVFNSLDSTRMVLLRRFSRQQTDSMFLWHFPAIDTSTPVEGRYITFVDPDSSGSFQKRCRVVDEFGRCVSRGDSILVLIAPPGPHDGFRTWYSVTYEERNLSDNNYKDLYVRDPACTDPDTTKCANLNNKLRNVTGPVEATAGPTGNVETVAVVPNPFRANEAWDVDGSGNEVHFVNLPAIARIRVYSVAGDLIRELQHKDTVRDFERWDLKNGKGENVSSGIYVYRVESDAFAQQGRFIVIR